jgi:arginine-tRNA-protein transferase
MNQIFRFLETPRPCSYLPHETASLEVSAVAAMSAAEYSDLLARGYRRFGWQVFRPACPECAACCSLRVLVREFTPDSGERRILRKNESVRAELHPLFASGEIVDLYNCYQRFMCAHRGWPLQQCDRESYADAFLTGAASHGRQWLYFEDDRLIGVALMDEVPDAVSLVYSFYHPDWRDRSPGTFSVLNQLLYAQVTGRRYAYLGYWIENCRSMKYKSRFRPHEILCEYPRNGEEPVWRCGDAVLNGIPPDPLSL